VKEHFFEPASADLVAEIDSIARRHGSREQVFDDLLTIAVCALAGGTREEEYLQTVKPYIEGDVGNRAIDRLVAVFGQIVIIMDETRSDVLGDIFQGAITRGQNQQFFTPDPICDLMARLTDSAESREGASAGSADAAEMKTICDPCCGSGRLLLAAARVNRNRYFVGQDIDHRCAKITAINLALWNLYGKVVWGGSTTPASTDRASSASKMCKHQGHQTSSRRSLIPSPIPNPRIRHLVRAHCLTIRHWNEWRDGEDSCHDSPLVPPG
jgi:hypothetical protein